ncbi:MAG TPA: hypothetical protein VNJ08_11245 [Bacteriovoracaceae bacterium]|nr:hypothetical protein [Bacteriovoracaceae bacterium]
MLKRKITIYSYLAQKKLKRQLKRLSNRNDVQVFKLGDDYDSHIIDDLPLTINRDPHPGFRMQEESAH